ncbi:MAG: hypothetical protein J0651_00710, partial [Actinobacteria bacterium]|nr:hypothetical protein [Actinomycetota bacterium]
MLNNVIGVFNAAAAAAPSFEQLVIAGGGGGSCGGGGAGGYKTDSLTLALSTNYTVTVGGGGTGKFDDTNATNG